MVYFGQSIPAPGLPDDPGTLRAMLVAERHENERLRQIIKEMQRHRFGRRAETLPEDQLLFALEEADQVIASGEAENEVAAPAERAVHAARRRVNRGSLSAHLPRIERVVDIDDHACPCCRSALHRIGEDVSASTSCRRSSRCWSFAARSMPAGLARTWSCMGAICDEFEHYGWRPRKKSWRM